MERTVVRQRKRSRIQKVEEAQSPAPNGLPRLENVTLRPKQRPKRAVQQHTVPLSRPQEAGRRRKAVDERIHQHEQDQRVQHELRELRETHDLRDIDDDVEDLTTLLAWQALEHTHRPKTNMWYMALAASITSISLGFALTGNIIAGITIALAGGLTYYIAQQKPAMMRYRIMADGVAFNNTFYHFQDLEVFNIVYKPGETKTVLLRSKRTFAPLLHMEIGDMDPVAIRDMLIEFVEEDIELHEPLIDIYARRLGF